MATLKTELAHRFLERGESLAGIEASNVHLIDCHTAQGPADSLRPLIENVTVSNLQVSGSTVIGAVLRNVSINGIKPDRLSGLLNANEFERVTIRGKVGTLVVQQTTQEPFRSEYLSRLREADLSSDWSLDISQAEGDIEIRGYASSRIRLNPEYQKVIRRERLLDGRWRTVDLSGSYFAVTIDMMITRQWNDTVLSANPRGRNYKTELAALRRLSDEGIIG